MGAIVQPLTTPPGVAAVRLQELRRSCTLREVRGWATRLLFILTRCSRLVATEESSPFGSGGHGGSHGGGAAYATVQPRSKGPGRLRRFSGFPMLRNQLSLDHSAHPPHPGAAVSPRGGASPLLRSATAPSRSFKDLVAGMHHLRVHDAGGAAGGGGHHRQAPPLSPMPESPSAVRSPAAASSDLSTPSHPVRQVGLSPLGRSVVTALEAELEQAARQEAGHVVVVERQQQQERGSRLQSQSPGSSSGTASPIAADSPSKRQNIFKLLKLRFQSLRGASKERTPAAAAAADAEADQEGGSGAHSPGLPAGRALDGMQPFGTPQVGLDTCFVRVWVAGVLVCSGGGACGPTWVVRGSRRCRIPCQCACRPPPRLLQSQSSQQEYLAGIPAQSLPPHMLLSARGGRRAMSADGEGVGAPHLPRLHPGLQKALTLQVESSPGASPLGGSPRSVVCRICEEAVGRDGLQRHSRVCAMLEAMCKQVGPCPLLSLRPGRPPSAYLCCAVLAATFVHASASAQAAMMCAGRAAHPRLPPPPRHRRTATWMRC